MPDRDSGDPRDTPAPRPEPAFKVGDRVKVLRPSIFAGNTGTIDGDEGQYKFRYRVAMNDVGPCWFSVNELAPSGAETPE